MKSVAPKNNPRRSEPLSIGEIVPLVKRNRATIGATFAATLAVTSAIVFALPDRYTATARVAVDSRAGSLTSLNDVNPGAGIVLTEIETQSAAAVSRNVLSRAAAELRLWSHEDFGPRVSRTERLSALFSLSRADRSTPVVAESFADLPVEHATAVIDKLERAVSAHRVGMSSVIEIRATLSEPVLAAAVANAVTVAYLDDQIEAGVSSAERAVGFLEGRVTNLSQAVSDAELALRQFVETETIAAAPEGLRDNLLNLRGELTTIVGAEADARARLASYRAFLSGGNAALLDVADAAVAERLTARNEVLSSSADDASVRERLETLDAALRVDVARAADDLASSAEDLGRRAADLRGAFGSVLEGQSVSSEVSSRMFRLEQDVETSRSLYTSFLRRLEEVRQQASLTLPSSRVLSSAAEPSSPSFPPRILLLMLALLFSIGAAAALAFGRERLFGGFLTRQQLERFTGIETAAAVPVSTSERPWEDAAPRKFLPTSEAFRRLASFVTMRRAPDLGTVVLVTSTDPAEGKSTCSIALARSLALNGQKTLLIDADMRRPSLARRLGGEGGDALNRFFSITNIPIDKCGAAVGFDGGQFDFFGAGETLGRATDSLVGGDRFRDLVEQLRQRYDFVVIDTPPVAHAVDAVVMVPLADHVLYLVAQSGARQVDVADGIAEMSRAVAGSPRHGALMSTVFYRATSDASQRYGGYYGTPATTVGAAS